MTYLLEFMLYGDAEAYAKKLISEISIKFEVKEVEVPHVTLFGPFETTDEAKLISSIISVLKKYDLVPFDIKGFNFFNV